MNKITIYGAGRVGESTAYFLANGEHCREIVLIDVQEGAARGAALDIQEAAPLFNFDTRVSGTSAAEHTANSDVVVITAGVPRKPGMSRSDVLDTNLKVIDGIVDDVARHSPDALIVMVTNPVDVLTYRAWQRSGFDRHRVFGLSGVLDAARMASFIALETGFSVKDISAMVLGGHGDAMVPLPRFSTLAGVPIEQFLDAKTVQRIVDRTRQGGAEILSLKGTGSANNSPAASIVTMIDAIGQDRRRLLPCVAYLDGEYGQHDIFMGVPAVLGAGGVEQVIELPLSDEELRLFAASAEQVQADVARLRA